MAGPADVERVRDALVAARRIGPFFAVEFAAAQSEWRTVADLWTDSDCLSELVDTAGNYLRSGTDTAIDQRCCASISSLGFMSRLVAPALATACMAGVVPRLDPHRTYWRPAVAGPVPIALASVDGATVRTSDEAAVELERAALLPCVEPVLNAYSRQFRLSLRVLRGNVSSALAGAATVLNRASVPLGLDPVEVVHVLLNGPSLTGTGHYERPFEDRADRFFVRHNCCLFYRIPGGGTCGDCVLVRDSARREMWQNAVVAATDAPSPTA